MAQVSIQYSLDKNLDTHDEKQLKEKLNEILGIKYVHIKTNTSLICVDYNGYEVNEKQLEQAIIKSGFSMTMVDKIMF